MGQNTGSNPTRAHHGFRTRPRSWSAQKTSALAIAVVLVGALHQNAHAVDTAVCDWKKPIAVPGKPVAPANALQQMTAQLLDCQKNAEFLSTLGQLLNSQGRYVEASDHLERALLLEPDLKDAQLSYAIALAGSGDFVSAKAMIDNLLNDPDLPATLRPLIENQKILLAGSNGTQELATFQTRISLATRFGYDSNLLGSPNLSSLALTLPGQTVVLPLDENYLARPAAYARADLQLELSRTTPQGVRWDAMASLRGRYSPAVHTAGNSQIDISIERSDFTSSRARTAETARPDSTTSQPGAWNIAFPAGGSYVNASASALRSNAGTRFSAFGLGGGWGGTWQTEASSACQARAGMELQDRNYLDNNVLSGRYKGLSLNWSCDYTNSAQLTFGFKAGRDHPSDSARPGGVQLQTSFKAAAFLPQTFLHAGTTVVTASSAAAPTRNGFLMDLEFSRLNDLSGYSPIIDSGRSRSVTRIAARLEYQYFFSQSVKAFVGAEWVGQASNIALFGSSSRGGYSGLRKSW